MSKPELDEETKKVISDAIDVHTRMEVNQKRIDQLSKKVEETIEQIDNALEDR